MTYIESDDPNRSRTMIEWESIDGKAKEKFMAMNCNVCKRYMDCSLDGFSYKDTDGTLMPCVVKVKVVPRPKVGNGGQNGFCMMCAILFLQGEPYLPHGGDWPKDVHAFVTGDIMA